MRLAKLKLLLGQAFHWGNEKMLALFAFSTALWLQKCLCNVPHLAIGWLVEPSCGRGKKIIRYSCQETRFSISKDITAKNVLPTHNTWGQITSQTNLLVSLLPFIYMRDSVTGGDNINTWWLYLPCLWKILKAFSSKTVLFHILILCLMGLSCSYRKYF